MIHTYAVPEYVKSEATITDSARIDYQPSSAN